MNNRNVARAVRITLIAAGAVGAGLYGVAGAAQEQLQEVIVTGSRIARPDLESASPITVISGAAIADAGITDIGDLVQKIPSMSGSPIGTTTNNAGDGSVRVDLRGMGIDRTVTLIDGFRAVDAGDYQTIPAVMIERIEVLKDGGSATYGADAVAGVVNVITRKNFDGLEISAQQADYFEMDRGAQQNVSILAGKTYDDGGHFVFGAEFVDQEAAYQSDAPWDFFQTSYYIYPEGCEKQLTAAYDGTPEGGCYVLGSSRIPEGLLTFDTQGDYMNEGDGLVDYDGHTYNYAPVNYIQTPYRNTNMFLSGGFDLTDTVKFEALLRANFRKSQQELAPMPYDTGPFLDPGYPVVDSSGALLNGVSADNYYLVQYAEAAGLAVEPVTRARRRMIERPRTFDQEVEQYQLTAGLSGLLMDRYDWRLTYTGGYRSQVDQDRGQFVGSKLFNALGPSADLNDDGQPECYRNISDPTSLIVGCVPLNLFGGPGTVTPEMYDYVGAILTDHQSTRLHGVEATIGGGAFALPGGDLSWALTGGWGKTTYTYAPDSAKSTFDVTGNKGQGTNGSLTSFSVGLEVLAPLFDNGSQALNVSASIRYDDYDELSEGEATGQLGFEFQVIENLKFRGTAGTVFRAPTITDLYSGRYDDFPTFSDPCKDLPLPAGCTQQSTQPDRQVLSVGSGNPDLKPETGETYTVGVVWTPHVGPGSLSLTVDYWQIDLKDAISSFGIQKILDDCYVEEDSSACENVTRDSAYVVTRVVDDLLNVAEQGAKGVDTELRYGWDTSLGQFDASFLWAHMLERTRKGFAGAPTEDLAGRYTDTTAENGGGYPADKINYDVKWTWNNLSITYMGEFISGLDADTFCNCGEGNRPDGTYIQTIDSFLYHDLVGSYDFGQGTRISAGVTNLTNEEPPFIEVGFNATTDVAIYRQLGRGYFVRLSHKF
jgi:iron complex outermembrane receptor protein